MDDTCAPEHEHDSVVARLVLDIHLCPDADPITALEDLPDTILDLIDQLPELHNSELSIILGESFAEGRTSRSGRRSIIQRVHPDDPVQLQVVDDDEPEE